MAKSVSYLAKGKSAKSAALLSAPGKASDAESNGETINGHPTIDKHFFDDWLPREDGTKWIQSITGADRYEAQEMYDAVADYTDDYHYEGIHQGWDTDRVESIDDFLNNPNMPVYNGGNLYRGITIDSKDYGGKSAYEVAKDLISKDTWTEPGITSFSTDVSVAKDFASDYINKGRDEICGIVIVNERNLTGVSIKHISNVEYENEVLHPSSIKDRGFAVNQSKTHFDADKNIFFIYVTENAKPKK